MRNILSKGIIRAGQVDVEAPIDLLEGSEVAIIARSSGHIPTQADDNRPMRADEIAATLAAMNKIEPFDVTDEERSAANAWETKVNDYSIANMDSGVEDVFR